MQACRRSPEVPLDNPLGLDYYRIRSSSRTRRRGAKDRWTQTTGHTEHSLQWDFGTAYDFFISLKVLHEPGHVGLRPTWAAGVRSRLPQNERKFLEEIYAFFGVPLHWVYTLPPPKDAATALSALRRIAPAERLAALSFSAEMPSELQVCLRSVQARRAYTEVDLEAVRALEKARGRALSLAQAKHWLDWWARAEEFGQRYEEALHAYYMAFFAEEERRLEAPLRQALQRAQELARELPVERLIAELSQGVEFEHSFFKPVLVLAPVYWSSPLLVYFEVDERTLVILFGGRPPAESLIPGEPLPEDLVRALKALADPTRLLILRYLNEAPQSPSQLARRLRLRAPTVVHHLRQLRLAGLVHIAVRGELRLYALRREALERVWHSLGRFLRSADPANGG